MTLLKNRKVYLPIQPILQIKYQDQLTFKDKIINVKVYKYFDLNTTLNNLKNLTNQTFASFASFYNAYNYNSSNSSTAAFEIIKKMWNVLSNAGRAKSEATKNEESLNISFTSPQETSDSKFIFTDLAIKFKEYGKFQLIFSVDGIESYLSEVIVLKKNSVEEQQDYVFNLILIIFFKKKLFWI